MRNTWHFCNLFIAIQLIYDDVYVLFVGFGSITYDFQVVFLSFCFFNIVIYVLNDHTEHLSAVLMAMLGLSHKEIQTMDYPSLTL